MLHRLARPLLVLGSVAIALGLREYHVAQRGPVEGFWQFVAFGLLTALVAIAVGLPYAQGTWVAAAATAALTCALADGITSIWLVFFPNSLPRFVLVASVVAFIPWYVVCWWLADRGHQRSRKAMRVLAIADVDELATLRADAERGFPTDELAYSLIGTIEVDRADAAELDRFVLDEEVTLIVLGSSAQLADEVLAAVEQHHRHGVRVRTMEQFYEQWLGKLPLSNLARSALLTDVSTIHAQGFASTKRMVDVVFATLGLLPLALATPFVFIGNLFGNRGPLLYNQPRVGLNGQVFKIHKFRTMLPAAEGEVSKWTAEDDPRITRFGAVLRRTHLDELPQMLDVLRGTLSLVGPRPEQPHYVEQLEKALPYYASRHVVKPGITGWAQVKFRYSASELDAREKLQHDLYYIRHQSLVLDLKIIKRTITQVLFAGGR